MPSTQVWETSHTGGHRFAPTFVSLPDGYLFGGPDAASRSLDACRGRSSLTPAAQAAELAVLRRLGASYAATARRPTLPSTVFGWSPRTARASFVDVEQRAGVDRPESCGKAAVASHSWQATIVESSAGNV